MGQRWVQAPEGNPSGGFGPDDQRGRMNLVTPDKVLQGGLPDRRQPGRRALGAGGLHLQLFADSRLLPAIAGRTRRSRVPIVSTP